MFGIPRWNIAIIVVVLAGMFGYATYFDIPTPERAVEKFYTSFYTGNYQQAVKCLSVNWAYSVLFPKYNSTPPVELLKKGDTIRQEMVRVFKQNPPSDNLKEIEVSIVPKLTKTGSKTAVVVYDYRVPSEKITGRQLALVVKESGKWRVFEISDVTGFDLAFLQQLDMGEIDQRMEQFFE
ncbi:MAG: hypothetical protein GXX09_01165 [Syntrophomonadaceae bacterium]|nr:hypothetical protein [Syntrophomonadaceae bacterium]